MKDEVDYSPVILFSFMVGVFVGVAFMLMAVGSNYQKGVIEGRNEILTQIVKERGLLNIEEIEK